MPIGAASDLESGRAGREVRRWLRLIAPDRDGLLVVGFDVDGRFAGVAVNDRHRSLSWVKVWELAELAAGLGAHALLLGAFPEGSGRRAVVP